MFLMILLRIFMDKVLVTGAFGFVGQWVVKKLLEQGEDVIALSHDNEELNHNWKMLDVHFAKGDIRDYDFLHELLKKYQPKKVFHLAAQAIVGEALDDPFTTMQTNIMGTENLLECLRNQEIEKIIIASSDKAYGNEQSPYKENTPLNGRYPYDCSKSCTDLISQCYRDTYNKNVSILRCGNIFGGGDLNWNRVFPEAIASCYESRPMNIRSDGRSMKRDYVYVEDVVSAYLFVSNLHQNEIVNVSYGTSYNVQTILETVQSLTGVNISPNIQNTAKCEIDEQNLDNTHLSSLGWSPEYNFEVGVRKAIDWYYDYLSRK